MLKTSGTLSPFFFNDGTATRTWPRDSFSLWPCYSSVRGRAAHLIKATISSDQDAAPTRLQHAAISSDVGDGMESNDEFNEFVMNDVIDPSLSDDEDEIYFLVQRK